MSKEKETINEDIVRAELTYGRAAGAGIALSDDTLYRLDGYLPPQSLTSDRS